MHDNWANCLSLRVSLALLLFPKYSSSVIISPKESCSMLSERSCPFQGRTSRNGDINLLHGMSDCKASVDHQVIDELTCRTVDQVPTIDCSTISSIHHECEVLKSATQPATQALNLSCRDGSVVFGIDNSNGIEPVHDDLVPPSLANDASTSDALHPCTPEQHEVSTNTNLIDTKQSWISNEVLQTRSEVQQYSTPDSMVAAPIPASLRNRPDNPHFNDDPSVCNNNHVGVNVDSSQGKPYPNIPLCSMRTCSINCPNA